MSGEISSSNATHKNQIGNAEFVEFISFSLTILKKSKCIITSSQHFLSYAFFLQTFHFQFTANDIAKIGPN